MKYLLYNLYGILYVDDTSEQEVDTVTDTTETKRRKVRSNRTNRVSVRKEQTYDHQMNVPGKQLQEIEHMPVQKNIGKKQLLLETVICEGLIKNYLMYHCLIVEVVLNILAVLILWI